MLKLGVALAGITVLAGVHAGELQVRGAKAMATVPGQPVAAAYLELRSDTDVELVSLMSEAAGRVELHRMDQQGDVMRMRHVPSLVLKAGEPVRLAQGALHLMLIDLARPLKAGQQLPLDLVTLDRQGRRNVTRVVVPVVKELLR